MGLTHVHQNSRNGGVKTSQVLQSNPQISNVEAAQIHDVELVFLCPVNLIRAWSRARVSLGQCRLQCFWKYFQKHFCDIMLHCLHFIKLLKVVYPCLMAAFSLTSFLFTGMHNSIFNNREEEIYMLQIWMGSEAQGRVTFEELGISSMCQEIWHGVFCCIQGYHVYKEIWEAAATGEVLV